MIIKTGLNNLGCLVTVEKLNGKFFYIDQTKGICKEVKEEDISKYID